MMSKPIRLNKDLDEYDSSDSEEEFDEREKTLLNKVRNQKRQYSDSEEEVFGIGNDSDSDSNKSDIALSDVEGQGEENDLPNIRAWGKDKRKYYGADYVDPDYGGYEGKDAQAAEKEEEEARNLQNQLVQQLDDGDFSLDIMFKKSAEEKEKIQEEIIKTDIKQLSKKQKLQLLQKESPEFFGLIEDFKVKMNVANEFLQPILQKYRKGQLRNCEAVEFVEMHYQLILNYASNIYMYLLLKLNKEIQNHPIIKRLYQYRQLLSQIEPLFQEVIKPQILLLLEDNKDEKINVDKKQKKTLKLLSNLNSTKNEKNKPKKFVAFIEENGQPSKKKAKLENKTVENILSEPGNEIEENEESTQSYQQENGVEKRAITYQMAKNKGLTPHRKKEQRNPRVKHKLKYRKAIIRRKGAVREPRKELKRYSGEISGIKATVSKSIKIKT